VRGVGDSGWLGRRGGGGWARLRWWWWPPLWRRRGLRRRLRHAPNHHATTQRHLGAGGKAGSRRQRVRRRTTRGQAAQPGRGGRGGRGRARSGGGHARAQRRGSTSTSTSLAPAVSSVLHLLILLVLLALVQGVPAQVLRAGRGSDEHGQCGRGGRRGECGCTSGRPIPATTTLTTSSTRHHVQGVQIAQHRPHRGLLVLNGPAGPVPGQGAGAGGSQGPPVARAAGQEQVGRGVGRAASAEHKRGHGRRVGDAYAALALARQLGGDQVVRHGFEAVPPGLRVQLARVPQAVDLALAGRRGTIAQAQAAGAPPPAAARGRGGPQDLAQGLAHAVGQALPTPPPPPPPDRRRAGAGTARAPRLWVDRLLAAKVAGRAGLAGLGVRVLAVDLGVRVREGGSGLEGDQAAQVFKGVELAGKRRKKREVDGGGA